MKSPEQQSTSEFQNNHSPQLESQQAEAPLQFVDQRPESLRIKNFQEKVVKSSTVQRLQTIQRKMQQSARVKNNPPIQLKDNSTGLPNQLKSGVENLSGYNMDDVQVHRNSSKPATVQAHAYTQGTNIHLASGQEKHLAHEAWHVVQQKQGRVQPTMQMKGVAINDDRGLEREADVMGQQAMQLKMTQPESDIATTTKKSTSSIQQMVIQGYFILGQQPYSNGHQEIIYYTVQHLITEKIPIDYQNYFYPLLLNRVTSLLDEENAPEQNPLHFQDENHLYNWVLNQLNDLVNQTGELKEQPTKKVKKQQDTETSTMIGEENDSFEPSLSLDFEEMSPEKTYDASQSSNYMEQDTEHSPAVEKGESDQLELDNSLDLSGGIEPQGEMGIETTHTQTTTSEQVEGDDLQSNTSLGELDFEDTSSEGDHLYEKIKQGDSLEEEDDDDDPDYQPSQENPTNLIYWYGYELGYQVKEVEKINLEATFNKFLSEHPYLIEHLKEQSEYLNVLIPRLKQGVIKGAQEAQQQTGMDKNELSDLVKQQQLFYVFDSDIDGDSHMVYPIVYHGEFDVMIHSNPVIIGQILTSKKWEGKNISPANIQSLKGHRDDAKTALSPPTDYEDLKDELENIGTILSNLIGGPTKLPLTYLNNSVDHGKTGKKIEGSDVKAEPLSIRSDEKGYPPANGTDSRLTTALKLAIDKHPGYSSSVLLKRMHLLNALVFGPGANWNLTPGPGKSNAQMEANIETPLKRAILNKGIVMHFEAKVNYNKDPLTASDADINSKPDQYRFNDITFYAKQQYYDNTSKQWKFTPPASADPDVKAIQGKKVTWDKSSLPTLTIKPRILVYSTNLESELSALDGVSAAIAKRISDFVKDYPNDNNGVVLSNSAGKTISQYITNCANGKTPIKVNGLREAVFNYEGGQGKTTRYSASAVKNDKVSWS